jgi:hypothetical protein
MKPEDLAKLSQKFAQTVSATDWSKLWAGTSLLAPVASYKHKLGPFGTAMLDPAQRKAMTVGFAGLDAGTRRNLAAAMASSAAFEAARESAQDSQRLAQRFAQITRGMAAVEQLPTARLFDQKDLDKIAHQLTAGTAWPRFEQVWADFSKVRFSPALRGVVDAAAASVSRLRSLQDEIDQGTPRFVGTHGWPLPLALGVNTVRRVVGWADRPKREVSRAMVELFRPRAEAFRASRDALFGNEAFADRRVPLRQAIRAMQRRDSYAAICTMLPLVEGTLVDVVFDIEKAPRRAVAHKAIRQLKEQEENFAVRSPEMLLVSATSGSALFDDFDRGQYGRAGDEPPRDFARGGAQVRH